VGVTRSAAALALTTLFACGRTPPPAASPAAARYVGGDTCRPCHAETWSTFARTGMGRSWYPLAGAAPIEDWTGRNTVTIPETGLRYTMSRRDGKFFMRQSIAGADGRESAVDERELTWVVGSAHHSRTYLVTIGDKLFQAPVCWYTQGALWDLCPGYESNNDYFSREISRTCVFCHNARMTLRPGAHNAYDEPVPHGIDCERCHGPGEAHVARWARGESPTGDGDPSIINPRRLTAELRMQICFQCHLGDSKATERVARYETALEAWRPGQPITAAMLPYRFSEATPHEYGLSAQADRLLLSRCFLESGGKLECVTCHNPHITVYRADRPADFFTAKCLSCHGPDACIAPPAARQATVPPDDCVACHMRRGEPDDHRHTQFTDHWIRRRIDEAPAPRTSVAVEPYLPKAVAALPEGERAYYTARAISLRAHSVPPPVQKRMWPDAAAAFQRAIDAGFSDPQARFFLGKALAAQGKHRDAAVAYAAAYAADPRDHDIALAHGQALLRSGRPDEAERVFERLASDHPDAAGPLAEMARAKAGRADYAGAAELFGKAVALEPWTASMRVNLAMMLSALERHAEAVAQAEQALRLDPEGAATWEAYATILTRADRAADAAQAMKKAKALAYASGGRMNDVRAM
jgi:Flp pilus assembly protein TadD